jgi:hypothetical protein
MIGATLVEIREYIESLSRPDGEYYLVCGRTGDRPVPATGKRFDRRTTAQSAAQATEQYRAALRRYDPQLPYYDVIVSQVGGSVAASGQPSGGSPDRRGGQGDPNGESTAPLERRALVEFCHRTAASVFETLSESDDEAVGTAVMDTYFELAETVDDPDDLCLCLLESMANELDTRLTPGEQAAVVEAAASRLRPVDPSPRPVATALSSLRAHGLLGGYTQSPACVDLDGGRRSTVVRVSGYALSPRNGRLPTLPIVLELHRRRPGWLPSTVRATETDDGWRLALELAREPDPSGLVSAPITVEGA